MSAAVRWSEAPRWRAGDSAASAWQRDEGMVERALQATAAAPTAAWHRWRALSRPARWQLFGVAAAGVLFVVLLASFYNVVHGAVERAQAKRALAVPHASAVSGADMCPARTRGPA